MSTGTIRRRSTAINRGVASGVRESNYLLSQVRAGPTPTPSSSNFSVTPDVPNGILISNGTSPASAKTDSKLTWTGSGLNIAGHLNYTGLVADSTDIANNTDALQMPWSNTGKTFKCRCTGSVSKVITFAKATTADIGKKIKIIQTEPNVDNVPGSSITFVLTTQTLDTSSYINTISNGISFATAGQNTLELNPVAPSSSSYGVGTIMTWEVISTSTIRCEVTTNNTPPYPPPSPNILFTPSMILVDPSPPLRAY